MLLASNVALGYLYLTRQASPDAAHGTPDPSATTGSNAAPQKTERSTPADIVLENKGYIVPAHQILVSPKVTGTILELNIEEGMSIREGFEIARLESTEYEADRDRAQALHDNARHRLAELTDSWPKEIGKAQADLGEANETLLDLKRIFDRNVELSREMLVTRQELQQSESQYKAQLQKIEGLKLSLELLENGPREQRIKAAQAELDQAAAELAKAEWRLGNCIVKAPIDGTILKKNAERGNVVNPVAFNGSFSLCEMADLTDLEADLSVQERDISKVFPGQRCQVRADAFPDRIYEGVVARLMPIADRAKGSITVRVKIAVPKEEKEGEFLKPEMVVTVTFHGSEPPAGGNPATTGSPAGNRKGT